MARQHLLGPGSDLPGRWPAVALAIRVTMPSGSPRLVDIRERVFELRAGPGFMAASILPALGIDYVNDVPVPVPLDCMYIGCGDPSIRLHPTVWCNPFASTASSEEDAIIKFADYAAARADKRAWLHPLSGMRLIAERGIVGAHEAVIVEMLDELSWQR